MKTFKILDRIFEIVTPAVFLLYGIFVITFSGSSFIIENYQLMLGIILMIGGVAKIADYIGGHKIKHEFNFDIIFGISFIVFGIIVLAKAISLNTICIIWGVMEILEGAFEIQYLIIELKNKKYLAFISLACALLSVVFGTLLCIEAQEDITIHLIVVGVVFIASAATQIVETVLAHKNKKEIQ